MVAADGHHIVLLGPPGSGKGTQAAPLAEGLGVPAISTGEMLRAAVDNGSELGAVVRGVMAAGELVGDELMAEVVRERLASDDVQHGFLLDGYPRTASQALTLDEILKSRSVGLDHVLFIDTPEPVLVARALGRHRADDVPEVIEERLRVYRDKTRPLVDEYRQRGLLREIKGDDSVQGVATSILQAIES